MHKKETIVIGIGNVLMCDEGIGPAIIEAFSESVEDYPNFEFVDGGTGGLSILHLLEGRKKAIIIDCAYMDSEPGTIRRFTPNKVSSRKMLSHQSIHEADIIKVIELSKHLDQHPDKVVFFGIEPERIEPGMELSAILKNKLPDYIKTIGNELVN